jgi:hypothetical protein
MLQNVGGLYERKIGDTNRWWDQAIAGTGTSFDEALDNTRGINTAGMAAIDHVYSEQQAGVLQVLNTVPGLDEATNIAAIDTVSALEDEIFTMERVSGEGTLRVMQAAEDLAVALAKSAKATSQLEYVRERIKIEEGLKSNITQMIEDRKAAQRAQGAAVRAAREAAAARLPDNMPVTERDFMLRSGAHYLNSQIRNLNAIDVDHLGGLFAGLMDFGMSVGQVRKLLAARPTYDAEGNPSNSVAALAEQLDIDWEAMFGGLSGAALRQARNILPNAMLAGYQASSVWRRDFVGGDPSRFQPGTYEYNATISATLSAAGRSDDEIYYAINDPNLLSYWNDFFPTTSRNIPPTSGSGGRGGTSSAASGAASRRTQAREG